MLSNTKCKKILNKNGIIYTDKEIVLIKDTLYKIADIIWHSHIETNKIYNSRNKHSEMNP
jgi:hypothetical protein